MCIHLLFFKFGNDRKPCADYNEYKRNMNREREVGENEREAELERYRGIERERESHGVLRSGCITHAC